MRSEDLFAAIGCAEENRLARSELQISPRQKEDKPMSRKPKKIFRSLLIAAVVVSMLAVTAYAVTGFLIFDNPEEMITALFGDQTGFDHSKGGWKYFEDGHTAAVEPTFDRIPAEEAVVKEEIAPKVDIVGQSVSANGYTLTVDAFLYDSATKCGILTYLLENPNGLPAYQLQSTGEIWYPGMPDPVKINHYGYPYIIQDKTTDTRLAAAYFFQCDDRRGADLEISLHETARYTPEDQDKFLKQSEQQIRERMTEADVLALLEENMGSELFDQILEEHGKDALLESAYQDLAMAEVDKLMDAGEKIYVSLDAVKSMHHITAGEGSILISPISFFIDVRPHAFLHTDSQGMEWISADNVDSIVLCFTDGSEYIVEDGYIINTMFALSHYPEGTTQTEHFVAPEDDPAGEGFAYMETSQPRCLLTLAFNRIVDVDAIRAVRINGVEIHVD